jgi:hypothetical protein
MPEPMAADQTALTDESRKHYVDFQVEDHAPAESAGIHRIRLKSGEIPQETRKVPRWTMVRFLYTFTEGPTTRERTSAPNMRASR